MEEKLKFQRWWSNMMDKNINELHDLLINKKITSEELVREALSKSHEVKEKYNAFVTICDDAKPTAITESLVSGIPFGVKDNYSTKDVLSFSGNTGREKRHTLFQENPRY